MTSINNQSETNPNRMALNTIEEATTNRSMSLTLSVSRESRPIIQDTYRSRLKRIFSLINPIYLFASDVEIKQCQTTLKDSLPVNGSNRYNCQLIVSSCVHPTTNEIIPVYGRMAAFAPFNIPICAGMLFTRRTIFNIISLQWLNQTYNAIFNHCNAAKSRKHQNENREALLTVENKSILKGYLGAVTTSVCLAVGLTQGLKRATLSPRIKSLLSCVIPYAAVASAGMANVGLMRIGELTTGLPLKTSDGIELGNSTIAARKALTETMISRAVLAVPTLLLPPPLIAIAFRWKLLKSNRVLKGVTEFLVVALGIFIGLPAAIALYPQESKLLLAEIEPELREKAKFGSDYVLFNKGL